MSADSRSRGANGCGCLSGGCLGLVVVLVILLGGIGAVGFIFYQKAREYTSAEPVPVPVYQASPEKLREVSSRVDLFKKAVDANQGAELELSADDINSLIADSDYNGFNQQ